MSNMYTYTNYMCTAYIHTSVLLSISIDKVRRQGVQWNLAAVLAVQLAFVVTGSCFGSSTGVRCNRQLFWRT